MPDPNLTGALKGALELLETDSPLSEATPDSVDELLDRINQHMADGMPERVTDADLELAVNVFRAQAFRWAQEEQQIKTTRRRKPQAQVIDVEIPEF